MTTGDATNISQSGATLTGSYSGATSTPYQLTFEYGTSQDALNNTVYWNDVISGTSGDFSASISGLTAGTTYYYRAVVQVGDRDFYGAVRSFTAASASTGDQTSFANSWLSHYEVPATSVSTTGGNITYSTVAETHGTTSAYIYNPSNPNQRIVTHTYLYQGSEQCSYTILYDKTRKCALWAAIEMDTSVHCDNNVGRNSSWKSDPAIPEDWQPNLSSSYAGDDRGHQIASSLRQTTVDENKQTFYYSNMTPQNSSLNGGKIGSLEQRIVTKANALGANQKMYVVTGPIFGSNPSTTTDASGVSCPEPDQYYYCIMTCTFNNAGAMTAATGCAYLFGKTNDVDRQDKTIDQIESLTGFDFFANVPSSFQTSAESSITSIFN